MLADDQFDRTLPSGWGAAPTGGPWTVSGSAANYAVAGGSGTTRVAAGGSTFAALAGVSTTSSDTRLTFGLDKPVTGSGLYLSVHGRRVSGAGSYVGKVRVTNAGAVNLALTRAPSSGGEVDLQNLTIPGLSYAPTDLLNLRLQATGTAPTTLRAKVWKSGTPEPTAWQVTATDSTSNLQAPGSVALSPYLSGAATNAPITVRVDSLVVTAP